MVRFWTAVSVALLLALPASAAGQGTSVPPGNSEADQYFETVPDGKGNKSLDNTREPADVLTPEQIAELEALGEDGLAAAQLAAATAPEEADAAGKGGDKGGGGGGSSGSVTVVGTQSPAVPEKDGLGSLLWVIVVGSAVAFGAYALARRSAPGGS